MYIKDCSNIRFGSLFIAKDVKYAPNQNTAKRDVIKKLLSTGKDGKSYISAIKDLGYDVLIEPGGKKEFGTISLSAANNLRKCRQVNGKYNTQGALYMGEYNGDSFDPDVFVKDVEKKKHRRGILRQAMRLVIIAGATTLAMFCAKGIVDRAYYKRTENKTSNLIENICKSSPDTLKLIG